jgi:DNA-binding GntR family transcriptional regulator
MLSGGWHEPFSQHHRAIIAAFRKADGAAARDHMIADIAGTQTLLRTLCVEAGQGQ